jgi:hypothetical protein
VPMFSSHCPVWKNSFVVLPHLKRRRLMFKTCYFFYTKSHYVQLVRKFPNLIRISMASQNITVANRCRTQAIREHLLCMYFTKADSNKTVEKYLIVRLLDFDVLRKKQAVCSSLLPSMSKQFLLKPYQLHLL